MENHLKRLVETRLKVLGKTAFSAAAEVSLGRTFIHDIIIERKRSVRPDAIEQMATALQLAPEEIALAQRGVWLDRWEKAAEQPSGDTRALAPLPADLARSSQLIDQAAQILLAKDIPLVGLAMGSVIQSNIASLRLDSEPIDYVWRPPALAKSRDIYAVLIAGESMAPMHPPGELRYVNPHRPVESGDTVIVKTRNWEGDAPQTLIKILRRRMPDRIVLEQLQPSAAVEIPLEVVESIHRVLTTKELFGL